MRTQVNYVVKGVRELSKPETKHIRFQDNNSTCFLETCTKGEITSIRISKKIAEQLISCGFDCGN